MKRLIHFIYFVTILSYSQPCSLGYELNGTDDFIFIPNTTYINTNDTAVANRTIETWFKTNDATTQQIIYEEGSGNGIQISVDSNRIFCGAVNDNGLVAKFFRSTILSNTWYHITYVISTSGTTTTHLWYLNGVLQDSQPGFAVNKHNANINIGRNGDGLRYPNCVTWSVSSVSGSNSEHCINSVSGVSATANYFDGNIWGFRIWNSGRTSTEINTNINSELTSGASLVAYLDDDTIEYLNDSGLWTIANANGNGTTYTWSSTAASSSWTASSNWNGGSIPSTTKLQGVVIPSSTNYPSISSEIRIGKLELSSPSSEITIQDGGTLNVYYDAVNSGIITVENNGSFILQDNEAITGSGNFVIERDTPNYPLDDYYSTWSTPVIETDSEIGTIFTNATINYEYDASQDPSAYVQVGASSDMEVGKGYFIRSDNYSGVLTRTFTGSVSNGCIDKTVYYNSAIDNFNLIGNPYSSALDWLSFYSDNSTVINGTMYYWNQSIVGINNSTSDYVSFNSTGSSEPGTTGDIATGQGFFVNSSQAGTITFRNIHRVVGNNNQFFRSENPDEGKSWFRLSGAMGYSPILIGFIPGSTDAYEDTHDALFLNEGASIQFYSLIDINKYEIQGRSLLLANQSVQIPLGYKVTTTGDYTISKVLEYVDSAFEIILEDTLLNTMTDLRILDYTFNVSSPTEDNNRFVLYYNYNETLGIEDSILDSKSISTIFSNDELLTNIYTEYIPITLQLFDVVGREIMKTEFNRKVITRNLSSGIYIVRYSFNDSKSISKKVIRK